MGCQGLQKNFTAYLDGELDRAQRETIDRHVRACPACRRDLETLRQTIGILHSPVLPVEDAPDRVRELLARKILAVRQPLSWRDRLFFWRVEGLPRQALAWGYGMAATALLLVAGAGGLNRLAAPGVRLGIVPEHGRTSVTTPARPAPITPAPAVTPSPAEPKPAPIRHWVEDTAVVGRATAIYLFVDLDRDLNDAEVRIYPAAGVSILPQAVLQGDASYLVYRGPVMRGSQQARLIPVVLRPSSEGTHTMRVVVREAGRTVAEQMVAITAVAPQQ